MAHLKTIFTSFGIMNAAFIGTTNIYTGAKNTYSEIRCAVRNQYNVGDKITPLLLMSFGEIFNCVSICAIKSVYFFALGPIGTYRICLAYRNYNLSGNRGYVNVLTCPLGSLYKNHEFYVIKPFGGTSWLPINSDVRLYNPRI